MFLKRKKPHQQSSLNPFSSPEIDSAIPAPTLADMPEPGSTRLRKRPKKEKAQNSLQPIEPEEAPQPAQKSEEMPKKTVIRKRPVLIAVCLAVILAIGLSCLYFLRFKPPAPETDARHEQYLAAEELCQMNPGQAAIAFYKLGDYQDARQRSFALWDKIAQRKTICSADYHIAAVKNDGTVVVAADTSVETLPHYSTQEARPKGLENVEAWTDIIAIDTTLSHIVGLKADGTVVAVGANTFGECNVSQWTDIVSVVAGRRQGGFYTIGLKADGTLVFAGASFFGFGVPDWTDVVKIFTGESLLVGLKADGTVVTAGGSFYETRPLSDWTDIADICLVYNSIFGLKTDGTVLSIMDSLNGTYTDTKWTDISAISTFGGFLYGIKTDGTLVAYPDQGYDMTVLTDIAAVAGFPSNLVCLKTDGTVLAPWGRSAATGQPYWSAVDGWTDMVEIYDFQTHGSFGRCLIGLKRDGTVKFRGYADAQVYSQTLSQWSDIKLPANQKIPTPSGWVFFTSLTLLYLPFPQKLCYNDIIPTKARYLLCQTTNWTPPCRIPP